ncbi:hypothetical protein HID58_053930 [Brassica napus]|uniref:Methyltransferase type 11 domain-containing protein n=1 Tax=Brassica napus TaxID=3708 RepID=A0ABQ8AHD4_BRANA|nr:hypothetical protein HID58_053930 [Brassica napus]
MNLRSGRDKFEMGQFKAHMNDLKMDVRDMKVVGDASFDAVIDKGRLFDYFHCCVFHMLEESLELMNKLYRVLEDKGVYILITYGAPDYRLRLFKDSRSWTTKLHVIDKSSLETSKWELTKPIPLDTEGGSSVESAIGKSPDVHNIYVCIKVCCLML